MAEIAPPVFIERNAETILSELLARYQTLMDKTLQPGQPEYAILQALAYREFLLREQANSAAVQNLVRFSTAPILDYLGDFVGVKRLAATPAGCTLFFALNPGHGIVTIPAGTRVSSQDAKVIFECLSDTIVPADEDGAEIEALCLTDGTVGNDYLAGTISTIIDPLAFVATAENMETTAGGADAETDQQLRDRIILAPSSFSVAGPRNAYIFWAKSAHPSIIDAYARSLDPGEVTVWPLVRGGIETPDEVLDAVSITLSADQVRPLTDKVSVESPARVEYELNVEITTYQGVIAGPVASQVASLLEDYTEAKSQKLGVDIVSDQVKALIMKGTVKNPMSDNTIYKINLVGFSDIVIAYNEFPVCVSLVVAVSGTNEG